MIHDAQKVHLVKTLTYVIFLKSRGFKDMTRSQINDTFLFQRVIKILTACRILQISIARCQIEGEIHNFPAMYGKEGGVFVVKIGEIKVSI